MADTKAILPADIPPPAGQTPGVARVLVVSVIVGCLAALPVAWAAGPSLGLFLGELAMTALLAPALGAYLAGNSTRPAIVGLPGFLTPLVLAELWPVFDGFISQSQWVSAVLVLTTFAAAGFFGARCLTSLKVLSLSTSAAVVQFTLTLWLTWPIWMSGVLSTTAGPRIVGWLVPWHPLFATNSAVLPLGVWPQQAIAYHLTILGQDVPYALPGVARCAAFNSVVTLMCFMAPYFL